MDATEPGQTGKTPPTTTDDGWRFHTGTRTNEQRRRLFWLMTRRSVWAMMRHGWRSTPGRSTVAVAGLGVLAAPVLWWAGEPPAVIVAFPLAMMAVMIGVGLPLSIALTMPVRLWRLYRPQSGWVAHWCEGPQGQLAVRMTRQRPAPPGRRSPWPGRDFAARGGAGKRLLAWLQHLADQHDAQLIIATAAPRLITYYQDAGFALARKPRHGIAVLTYPANGDAREHAG